MEHRKGLSASSSLPPLTPYPGTSLDLPVPSHTFITGLQGPTTLLDGTNYVTWSAGFCRFLEIHGQLSFLTDDPPSLEDPRFATWITQDQAVTSWLLKMAIPTIAKWMQLLSPSKAIWDEWARMYGYRSNIGRTVEIVEGMFCARQGIRSLQEFYATLRSLLNQLEIYQPYTPDLTVQRHYWKETTVGLFLAGINPTLGAQIRGPILSSITLPTLGEAFSTALRVSSPGPVPTPVLTESTALSSETRPRGRGSDNGGRGREKGRGRDGKLYPPYVHCQKFGHRSDKCWQKFGKPDQVSHSSTTTSASASNLLTISREELAHMLATRAPTDTSSTSGSHTSHLASTSTSGTALLASSSGPWIIDSGASAHMSGTSSLLSQIASLPHPETFAIVDGRVCPVRGKGRSLPTRSLPLSDVLYVPNFPVNLLSISAITKSLFCSVSFFPYHCTFQDLRTGKRIGLGHETGRGIYELVSDLPPTGGEVPLRRLHPDRELFALPPRTFGCVAFVHDHSPNLSKLAPRSLKGVSVGYSRTQKGYRVYLPDQRRYLVSADVTFFETTRYFTTTPSMPTSPPTSSTLTLPSPSSIVPPPLLDVILESPSSCTSPPSLGPPAPSVLTPEPDSVEPPGGSSPTSASSAPLASAPTDLHLPIALRKGTRSCTLHPISTYVHYDRLHPTYRAFTLSLTSESIPRTHVEALRSPHWKAAMDAEYAALTERQTWILVPRPLNTNIVTCRWIFTVKYHADGTVDRYKARLVGWPLHQLDVSNAFLYGELTEWVFMEQPPGYITPGSASKVCHLQRALYSLKQSPHAWFAKFSKLVLALGLTQCTVDPTVFRRHGSKGTVILAVYVDDILLTGSDHAGLAQEKHYLHQHLTIRDLGTPKYFLSIEFAHQLGKLILNQQKYVLDMLEEAGLLGCKPCLWDSTSPLLTNVEPYRRLVGKLIYLTVTRPDIAYQVALLSQFMQAPQDIHWHADLRVLAYLKHAPGRGYSTSAIAIYAWRPTRMQVSLAIGGIGSPLQASTPLLVET
ncbi:uncharacterized protein LOC144714219 [Wolffia australiana]